MSLRSIRTWLVRLSALTTWLGALMAAPILLLLGPDLAMLAALYGAHTEPPRPALSAPWLWIALLLFSGLTSGVAELAGRGRWLAWLSHALSIAALYLCGAAWLDLYTQACG